MHLSQEQPDSSFAVAAAPNDSTRWELFKSGDRDAFSEIYQAHIQALYSYGTKICPETEVVEDCIQELFIYLWQTKENLGPTNNIKFYLFKSLRRRLQVSAEAHTKRNKFSNAFAKEEPMAEASPEHVLIAANVQENQQERMQQAMLTLTKRQREAIYLRFYDNLSFQEIAEIMGLQLKSTYNLISKAIEMLREHVQAILLSILFAISLPS
ncbi:DNA-directed RNA polymerase sigma-70 factor [Adhaeribacter aerolatus]|uniref:DNA-directed RNA polymerase sigma-70 factor n=1 Tax=Adhaeribacter aerolatus TaxID=670289 RepID=A0A512AVJ5_9BACT|nr:sigma-70 family RNA polymerase sigma factor [Adhaeribacter aerolatus]GEO03577.1 DNA-directed RNA polymerase sigma-70 factor [Adhaeribacter aerolatus]